MYDWLPDNHLAKYVVEIVDCLDIGRIECAYAPRGGTPYSPRMLLCLLFYGYATGVFSSRKLEKATYERVDFRYITCDQHPDHDTINEFRKRFLDELKPLFVQILLMAREMGVLKLGNVAIDGTKVKANASKHKAVSYKRAQEIERQLESEIVALLEKAAEVDNTPDEDNDVNLPEELARRENRLEKIKQAKSVIEDRARARYKEEKRVYDEKLAERKRKAKASGKKPRGRAPKEPEQNPHDKEQYNYTDPESRIMKDGASGGFEQAYNAQAAVDTETMLIAGEQLSDHCNDKQELAPTLDSISKDVGKPETVAADSGYYSEDNVAHCEQREIEPFIATGRTPHNKSLEKRLDILRGIEPPPLPEDASPKEKMAYKLRTQKGRSVYRLRKMTVETVFGIIKEVLGFRRFHLRGVDKVAGEWTLACIGYNLKRLHVLQVAV
jgi:transposase